MQVVIDKSYLQGASAGTIQRLCGEHAILFIERLLYELLTTESEEVRTACFEKLRRGGNSVILIPRVGPLLRYEMKHLRPASPLSDHRIPATLEQLIKGVSSRSLGDDPSLDGWSQEIQREVETFRQVATGVSAWCPALLEASSAARRAACQDLKRQACSGPDVVRRVYLSLGLEGFPASSLLDPSWVSFRWMQMHLLFGLDYISRYGFSDLTMLPKRLENDVHDLQYVLFGTLCGALATKDVGIAENFTMACPEGVLFSGAFGETSGSE